MYIKSLFPEIPGVGRYYYCNKCEKRFSLKGKKFFYGIIESPKCPKCGSSDTGSGKPWKNKAKDDVRVKW